MRRSGSLLLAVVAVFATATPVAAQPKVTITGFTDNITSYTHNISQTDLNPARNSEHEWYARTRVRPDIVAEVGTTKFVLGLEIDYAWGQTGGSDGSFGGAGPQRFGTTAGFDQNTDVAGITEVKWAYTEFAVPLIPVATRLRVGAQPYTATYKTAVLATGDYAGAHLTSQLTPGLRTHFTYAQTEEASTGPRDGFIRGEDSIIIASAEITPFKGLNLRPIFSYANLIGATTVSARQNRAGLGGGAAFFPTCPGAACGAAARSSVEDRFTVGLDARWRTGPFYFDPTVFYQFGSRDQVAPRRRSPPARWSTRPCNGMRGTWTSAPAGRRARCSSRRSASIPPGTAPRIASISTGAASSTTSRSARTGRSLPAGPR
jgi:hypothetical protein